MKGWRSEEAWSTSSQLQHPSKNLPLRTWNMVIKLCNRVALNRANIQRKPLPHSLHAIYTWSPASCAIRPTAEEYGRATTRSRWRLKHAAQRGKDRLFRNRLKLQRLQLHLRRKSSEADIHTSSSLLQVLIQPYCLLLLKRTSARVTVQTGIFLFRCLWSGPGFHFCCTGPNLHAAHPQPLSACGSWGYLAHPGKLCRSKVIM